MNKVMSVIYAIACISFFNAEASQRESEIVSDALMCKIAFVRQDDCSLVSVTRGDLTLVYKSNSNRALLLDDNDKTIHRLIMTDNAFKDLQTMDGIKGWEYNRRIPLNKVVYIKVMNNNKEEIYKVKNLEERKNPRYDDLLYNSDSDEKKTEKIANNNNVLYFLLGVPLSGLMLCSAGLYFLSKINYSNNIE